MSEKEFVLIDPQLMQCLRCPESRQTLSLASESLLAQINQQIAQGSLQNGAGRSVSQAWGAALVREDSRRIFPVIDGIPVMLLDESVVWNP